MTTPEAAAGLPLRLGRPEEFACIREFLQEADFNEATLLRLLGMEQISDLGRVRWDELKLDAFSARLRWSLQVFARDLAVGEEECRTICGAKVFAALQALGLLRPPRHDPRWQVCPVWLYPVDGFLIVSDRTSDPDGGEFKPAEDVVFPAIYGGTLRFLRLLPESSGGDALDLCGGTGIGALRLARTAAATATADIAARSSFFAEFNASLNDSSVVSLCGDVYAPVAGRQFDLITAHPPFVPATGPNMVYRDGGATGEEVTQRVIEGLPAHLRVGGTGVVLCVARDTQDQTFEQRSKEWLGEAAEEFEVVFGLEKILTVREVVESLRARGQNLSDDQAKEVFGRLESMGTKQFVYGALFIRRHPAAIGQKPFRIGLTPEGGAPDFERLLAWRQHCRQPGTSQWLNQCRPRLAPRLQLTARHVVHDGDLVPAEFVFSIVQGLEAALRLDAWLVPLVARFNGERVVKQIFSEARSAGEMPEDFGLENFANLVQVMVEKGFLEVDITSRGG